MGITSLVLTLAGFWAGRYGETTGRDRRFAPVIAVGAITLARGCLRIRAPLHARRGGRRTPRARDRAHACVRPEPRARASGPRARPACRGRGSARGRRPPRSRSSSEHDAPARIRSEPSSLGRFLPPDPRVREPHRLTPQLALRVAILGVVALVAFTILFFRLWSLQVLSGDEYLNAAQNNQLRLIRVEAPRGPILDRRGRVVVSNVAGTAVRALGRGHAERRAVRARPAARRACSTSRREALAREVDERRLDPLTPIIVKTSVGEEQVNYLYEHQAEFPGVEIVQIYLRDYRTASLAAQILGYTGEISPEELKRLRRDGYRAGDRIGKTGIEAAYDSYLRGRAGLAQIRVDSLGRQVMPDRAAPGSSTPGYALRLTLDMRLQRAAEEALQYGIDLAHQNDQWAANGGAIVALDPRDGAVLAMASAPTYKPSVFVGPHSIPKKLEALLRRRRANNPLFNRAIAGLYPPGSTWKPVTALAGMQEHVFSAYESLQCTPFATYGLDQPEVPQLEPVRQPPDDAARGARRVVRHVLLRDREPVLRGRLREPRAHAAVGAAVRVRRARPGSTSAARPTVSCRRPSGGGRRSRATGIARGTRETRSSSRSARRTFSSRRSRWPPSTRCSRTEATS